MSSLIPWKRREMEPSGSQEVAPLRALRHDWDTLFDRFFGSDLGLSGSVAHEGMRLDVTETDEAILVHAEVPGVDPERLDISLSGDLLTLSAEKADDADWKEGTTRYSERHFGKLLRTVRLPCPVDADQVAAEHRHGVVKITLPKVDAARPRRIAVKSG